MPNGYVADSSTTRYDGQALPQDVPSPLPASQECGALAQTASIRAAGINTADFAQATYANQSRTAMITEEIDAFQGADARNAMTALWHAFGLCKTFDQEYAGVAAPTSLTRSALRGTWPGIKAVEISPTYEGGLTLVFIRVGYAIVTVLDSSTGSDDGSAAISMAERLADRLAAAEKG